MGELWSQRIQLVPGWLNSWEGRRLMDLAEAMAAKGPIVEIGMYWGRSTLCLAEGVRRAGKGHIWTIDLFEETYTFEGCPSPHPSFVQSQQTLVDHKVQDLVTIVNGDSRLPSTTKRTPDDIALLFVDGDHVFDALNQEWKLWKPKLSKDSVIVFHDYDNECVGDGVTRFCDEVLRPQFLQVEVCDRFKREPGAIPGGMFIAKSLHAKI